MIIQVGGQPMVDGLDLFFFCVVIVFDELGCTHGKILPSNHHWVNDFWNLLQASNKQIQVSCSS